MRLLLGIAAILLMYPPLLALLGVSGWVLNAVGAAGVVAIVTMRGGVLERRPVTETGAE